MNREHKLQALSVEYKVDFGNKKRKGMVLHSKPKKIAGKLPRISRLLALAHHLQGLVDKGIVSDYADIARLSKLSRPRITQIMNLTLLAPNIQEAILSYTESSVVNIKEQDLRKVLKAQIWREQGSLWEEIKAGKLHLEEIV